MKSIIIQLNESGACATAEDRLSFQAMLKEYATKEVEIHVIETSFFDNEIENAFLLLNNFGDLVKKDVPDFTVQEIAILRGKMADCFATLSDWFAKAAVNEKQAESHLKITISEQAIINVDKGDNRTIGMDRARTTTMYKKANDEYISAYAIRKRIEVIRESLDKAMNAMSGIQKGGDLTRLKMVDSSDFFENLNAA